MYGYLFQVDYSVKGPRLRMWLDVSDCLGTTGREYIKNQRAVQKTRERLGLPRGFDKVQALQGLLGFGQISERFSDAGGTFLVKTEEPMTTEDMEKILAYKQQHGELEEFFKAAKI